jgi:hypothetical protein
MLKLGGEGRREVELKTLFPTYQKGGDNMKGGIYSTEKCSICGQNLRDNRKDAVSCTEHPEQRAKSLRAYFQGVTRRFSDYEKAGKFLSGLRHKSDENIFDASDYKKSQPHGFANQVEKFLSIKKKTMKPKGWTSYRSKLAHAGEYFENTNVKSIQFAELEDFFNSLELNPRTVHHIRATLKTFYHWLVKRKVLNLWEVPEFPVVKYQMAVKKTVTKEDQLRGLEQLFKDTWSTNPRIFLAVAIMCSTPEVRPGELRQCNEEHLYRESWVLTIPDTKEGREKQIELNELHVSLFKKLTRGFPSVPLFRYESSIGGQPAGARFGHHVLNDTLVRSLEKIGIHGVSLYAFCKHSTLQWIDEAYGFDEAVLMAGHTVSATTKMYLGKRSGRKRALRAELTKGQEAIVADVV